MLDLALSLTVLAAFALVGGSVWLFRRGQHRKQAWLMAVLAVIMLANVAIWAIPGVPDQTLFQRD